MRNTAVKLLVTTGAVAALFLGGHALAGAEPQAAAVTCNSAQMQNVWGSNLYQSCSAPSYNSQPQSTW